MAALLPTREDARRWFEACLAAWGRRAVVDTWMRGGAQRVTRRAEGVEELLTGKALAWEMVGQQVGATVQQRESLEIYDARQRISLVYDAGGRLVERVLNDLSPGRLVELAAVARGKDGFAASVALVAGLDDGRHGPGRIHYPVLVPGGVETVWRMGLVGCRRALAGGGLPSAVRFLVADGLEGRALGWGVTREEALAAYAAEVARELPRQRHEEQFANDDYDDDGNLLARGSLEAVQRELGMPELGLSEMGPAAVEDVSQLDVVMEREEEDHGGLPRDVPMDPDVQRFEESKGPQIDPVTGSIDLLGGPIFLRGPRPDAPPVPERRGCVPHVILPLEPSPPQPPARGRWVRTLGEAGRTRHAVRIKDGDGYLLVGADLLGLVNLSTLPQELDVIDATADGAPQHHSPFERYYRYRERLYAWRPATAERPERLADCGTQTGSRYDAGSLNGDDVQAQVRRYRRIPRPASH